MHWKIFLAGLLLSALYLSGCMPVREGERPEETYKLGEDVRVGDAEVSRLMVKDAREAVRAAAKERIAGMEITISLPGLPEEEPILLKGTELPLTYDVETALQEASWLTQYRPIGAEARGIPLNLALDPAQGKALAERIAKRLSYPATDATAAYDPDAEGMFVYTEGQAGRQVDAESLYERLSEAAAGGVSAAIEADWASVPPAYTAEDAAEDHRLVASYTTSYAKSPHNAAGRVFNIEKAASLIDGVTIAPGEEFDMNAILGPRNGDTGWRKAAGIRDGKYEQEYGGGVCQVSTTLFNAVMMADLTITERRPHSWPSGYVDIGRDATISTGGPNFKFVNSSDGEVVVSARTGKDKKITVSIYGKPLPDGMTIRVSSERTGTLPRLGTETKLDASLPAGTTVTERQERRGKTSATYKAYYDANGELIRKETAYEDKYRSIQGLQYVSSDIYYGTGEE